MQQLFEEVNEELQWAVACAKTHANLEPEDFEPKHKQLDRYADFMYTFCEQMVVKNLARKVQELYMQSHFKTLICYEPHESELRTAVVCMLLQTIDRQTLMSENPLWHMGAAPCRFFNDRSMIMDSVVEPYAPLLKDGEEGVGRGVFAKMEMLPGEKYYCLLNREFFGLHEWPKKETRKTRKMRQQIRHWGIRSSVSPRMWWYPKENIYALRKAHLFYANHSDKPNISIALDTFNCEEVSLAEVEILAHVEDKGML